MVAWAYEPAEGPIMADQPRLLLDMVSVDRQSDAPLHRQLHDTLRRLILDGRIPADTLLPSTRSLAEDLKVGRNTVVAAYEHLLTEGLIAAHAGRGTWVAVTRPAASPARTRRHTTRHRLSTRGRTLVAAAQATHEGVLIDLSPGAPETAAFPHSVWSRLLSSNARRRERSLLEYASFAGHTDLRRTIASHISLARGIDCAAGEVIIVTGAQAALDLVARVLLDPGDAVWMEEPGYRGACGAFLAAGSRPTPLSVSRNGWEIDAAAGPPRLIYVTPSCQWPLGVTMRAEERTRLLEIAARHDAIIVEDDYDGEFRLRGRPLPALRAMDRGDRVIYVGSFGKTLLPSLRLGYLIVPAGLADAFAAAVSVTGQFAPLVLQATLNDFVREGHFARHLKQMRSLYARRQAHFIALCHEHLSDWLSVPAGDAGMHLVGTLLVPVGDRVVADAALDEGVAVQCLSQSHHFGQAVQGLLLGYAALDDRQAVRAVLGLKAALERVAPARPAVPRIHGYCRAPATVALRG